jgi:hypothetical protein
MDGQRFDQLAKAFAQGASRRGVLKGLVGGAVGAALAQISTQSARAQCSWSGTFEAPFNGDISMTLNEADGQVTGSYAFTQDNAVREGTISGIVRSEYPGYSVLDGYWREPGEGGRIWFAMPLDACAQFTGSYTETDASEAWIAGWDGVRTSGGGDDGDDSVGDVEITFFTNPGDSVLAMFTENGESITVFGSRDADGLVERIRHVEGDAPDGDPQKRVFLDFADDGTLTRGALGNGETMLFAWESDTRVIITYMSADGSPPVQIPIDANEAAANDTAAHALESEKWARGDGEAALLAYSGHADMMNTLTGLAAAGQDQPPWNEGTIEVRCADGRLVHDAWVQGSYYRADMPKTGLGSEFAFNSLNFYTTAPGVWKYTLPRDPAPETPPPGLMWTLLVTGVETICRRCPGRAVCCPVMWCHHVPV